MQSIIKCAQRIIRLFWLSFLAAGVARADESFRFEEANETSLRLWEGKRPVLVYNHGVIRKEGVPADRARSSYVHPLYGLDGEVLTDDFPTDHYHHRGLFWAWPHVKVGEVESDLWMLKGIRQQFQKWLARDIREHCAVLGVQNGWFVGQKKVVDEQVWLKIMPATGDSQAIDVELILRPLEQSLTLRGAEGKSYGGLTLRFAPRKNTRITTPNGSSSEDLPMARLPWADLTAQFTDTGKASGVAIFIHPGHPDFPPEWLTRHYGVLCVGWPGIEAKEFSAGDTIRCRYRLWIHRDAPDAAKLKEVFREYCRTSSNAPPLSAQSVRAEQLPNRIRITIDGELFTEYLFAADQKYPYFYPVNGPRSGKSITERRLASYPHHSSIFFGCDKVNGGNFWQEGLTRGQIVSKRVDLVQDSGDEIQFQQQCAWERPGVPSPFDDFRTVRVNAPNRDLRCIDFEIKLVPRTKVRIEKTNHSLFSARLSPELSVLKGSGLFNANGDEGEQGTFGKEAPWADFRGSRDGAVEGLTIMCHPSSQWFPCRWFTRDYGFMSPTPFYWPKDNAAIEFEAGKAIYLRYRVLVHAGNPEARQIQAEFDSWIKPDKKS